MGSTKNEKSLQGKNSVLKKVIGRRSLLKILGISSILLTTIPIIGCESIPFSGRRFPEKPTIEVTDLSKIEYRLKWADGSVTTLPFTYLYPEFEPTIRGEVLKGPDQGLYSPKLSGSLLRDIDLSGINNGDDYLSPGEFLAYSIYFFGKKNMSDEMRKEIEKKGKYQMTYGEVIINSGIEVSEDIARGLGWIVQDHKNGRYGSYTQGLAKSLIETPEFQGGGGSGGGAGGGGAGGGASSGQGGRGGGSGTGAQ